ncbi:MAG TPA: hypothetical protein VG273_03855 [Bryobacteraceae bacterium]|jgi:hypothetical protein|nr:hypothetical protein [Bryobacteraceae bacterium]
MTRREANRFLLALGAAGLGSGARLLGQNRPDSFKVYSESPRLLLRPARLKLLRRERERRSLRWDQFETLWTAGAQFPELGLAQALRYQIAGDRDSGTRAVAWAVGPGADVRQIALIADWCGPLISKEDLGLIQTKLRREIADSKSVKTLADARNKLFAAVVLSDSEPAGSEKAIEGIYDGFWTGSLIPALRGARDTVPNPDAYALMEIMHVFRDNLNFDLRETFPKWFEQHPILHLMAHYPAPWPDADNEFRIPADETIESRGPDVRKAALSRAAELAMVAYDANIASSQLLQGWLTNDRFLMRGTFGMPYELLWANPYQPGLSYQHVPLALHDEIGGQLYVRSSWDDDASWIGFFKGQLQLFQNGSVTRIDPQLSREPLDIDAAVVFFARNSKRFQTPAPRVAEADASNVFMVGLERGRPYHVEIDGEEMVEETADPGGIIFLRGIPGATGVRLGPAPV